MSSLPHAPGSALLSAVDHLYPQGYHESMNTPSGSPLATLHPAWGAVLMTLSGASLLALRDPLAATDVDTAAGLVLLVLAALVGAGVTVASLARLARHPAAFRADLDNPGIGAMIASWPAGLMVLALATLEAGTSGAADETTALVTAMILFVTGLLGTLALGYMFYSRVIGIADVPLPAMSGNWFVPVVPLVLVPSILVRALALGLAGDPAQWTFAALAGWGIGFGLFLLLAAIIGSRLLPAAPPPPHLAPSWWVWLAPLGAGGLGLIALARMGSSVEAVSGLAAVAVPLASIMWAFAAWWMLLAIRVLFRERRSLHFHIGWWGFGFPTAAFATLTLELGRLWAIAWLTPVAIALWIALLLLIVWLAYKTVRGALDGSLWRR